MFKISGNPALVSKWQNLITAFAKRPFKFGDNKEKYSSIDDILDKLGVEVKLIKGKKSHLVNKKELEEAIKKFWDNVFNSEKIKEFNIQQILDECNKAEKNNDEDNNTGEVVSVYLRGCYIPEKRVIKLYLGEMKDEYGGRRMEELIVSTLAHETMHAYFNRPGHDSYPYLVIVEEPLAEFGKLLYLKETNCVFYDWAKADTENKTCYRYGAKLMDLYIDGKNQCRSILEDYKTEVKSLLQSLCPKLNVNP